MIIKIEKKEIIEKEITFPLYTKTVVHNFYFENEKSCISVMKHRHTGTEIKFYNTFPECWMLEEPSTKEEFNARYIEVVMDFQEKYKDLIKL